MFGLLFLLLVAAPLSASAKPMSPRAVSAYPDRAQVCVERYEDLGSRNTVPTTVMLGNDEVELTVVGGFTACGQVYTGQPVNLELRWSRETVGKAHTQHVSYPALNVKPGQVIRLAVCANLKSHVTAAWILGSPAVCGRIERALWCDPRKNDCAALWAAETGERPARRR